MLTWRHRVRLALYERATLYLFTANGPFTLAALAPKTRSLVLAIAREDAHGLTMKDWQYRGFGPGSQMPYVEHICRLIWQTDTAENIVRETLNELQSKELKYG